MFALTGHSTKYFYAADGTLERMVLPNSQVVNGQTQTYANRELKFTYETVSWGGNVSEPFKVLSQLIDAKGNTTSFTYGFDFKTSGSSTKGTTTVVDALGNNRAYSNDAEYVQWRQANGYYQSYSASAVASSPSLQAQVDAIRNAHALTYAFREDGLITEVIDQQGFRTSYTYDAANNLVAVTDNNGWGATKSDSPYYRKVRAELGIVDASGNGKLVTNLTAQDISALLEAFTAHYEYDSRGNLTKSIDNADKETSYIYNDFNKLVSSTSASGHIAAGKASEFKDSSQPATVALLGGGYVTVFTDLRGNDGDGYGIFSQRFDAAGNHQGGPVQVNSCTINKQQAPEIVALNDGGYFVAWENLDGSGTGIFGQRFAADGMRVGSEIRLNSHTGNYQDKVSLTALVDGGFVAVWQSDGQDGSLIGVYGQRFAADGSVVGSEFQVNTYTNSNQDTPAIASLADGGFVVAWESFDQDGSADGIYAKRYAADGNVVGSEFQVNSTTSSYQRAPAVVSMTDGGFVVAWGYNDVYGQRYGADGAKVGTEFQINTYTTNTQQMPVLAEIPGGGFVAVWEDSCQDGDNWGIYAQCFGVNGNKVGAEFHVSTTTAGNQLNPTATVLADGKLVVSYESTYIDNSGVTRTEILQSVIPIVLEGSYGSPLPPGFGGRNESRVTNTGLILKQALLNQYTTYYEYDEKQNLIERRDPGGDITRFEYDASGNLIRKIVFLDANDLVTVSKQQVTTYVYDGFGQMVRSVDAEGNQALNEYDHFGNLIRHTDARGAVTTYTYDADNRLLSVIDPISFHTIYAYDAVGNRIAVTNAKGRTLTQIYDANNNLLSTLDPALSDTAKNRLTSFEYDVVGNRTAVVDAAGNRSEYVFNARRELVETVSAQVADENGTATRYRSSYAYDGRSNLISSTDNRGFTTEILYTNDNLVRQKTDPAGHITRFEYDANGNQIQIIVGYQLPVGQRQIVKFGYDEEDQQITATDAKGNITRRTYDAVGNVTSLTDANGKKTDFTYDRNNRLLREIRPEVIDPKTGVLTRYVLEHRYDQNGNTIETIDENGRSTKYFFNRKNLLVSVIDANNVTSVFGYDGLNNRTTVYIGVDQAIADGNGDMAPQGTAGAQVTTYTYDEFNQLISRVDGLGSTYTQQWFTYDKLGNRITSVDMLGRTTSSAYDGLGRQASLTDATGKITRFAYDGNNNLVKKTDANGRISRFAYDGLNRLTQATDALGVITGRSYDAFGNLLSETKAQGLAEARTSSFQYDLNNRVIAQTDPMGATQSIEYDAVGNRTRVIDGRGNATRYVYNALNRNIKIIDSLNFETRFEYDGVGNRLSLINARGGIARFEYDPGNRLVKTTDAEGRVNTFAYDVRNNRIEQRTSAGTAAEELTRFEYDSLGNLRRVTDAKGAITENRYDGVSNRTGIIDANGNLTTMAFDAVNRTIQIADAQGQTTSFSYDAVGNTLTQTDSLGRVTQYVYDANDRKIKEIAANGVETQFAYDALGNRTRITYAANTGAAASDTFVYDKSNRLISQTNALGQTTTYSYDANGNCTRITDANGNVTQYVYDANNRVSQITDPLNVTVNYAYDGDGNRTQVTDGRGFATTSYFNANNEVTLTVDAEGFATSYSYDTNGNLLTKTLHTQKLSGAVTPGVKPLVTLSATDQAMRFEYDKNNRVSARIDGEGYRTEYIYDAAGNRSETRQFRNLTGTDVAVSRSYFDKLNREIAKVSAEGYLTEFVYDQVGNLTSRTLYNQRVTIPASGKPSAVAGDVGRRTTLTYDSANRLVSETSPLGVRTDYQYDARGNRTAVIEAAGTADARTTSFTYDNANRVISTRDAAGVLATLTLDGNGNITARREASGTAHERLTTFAYDRNNRLISQTDALGIVSSMTYDAAGNLASRTTAVGRSEARTETFSYDKNNRLLAQVNGEGERTEFAYDGAGNKIRTTLGAGSLAARTNTFEFDRDNRLAAAVDGTGVLTRYIYDGAGNKIETVQASGVAGQERHSYYQYDLDGRLTQVKDPMGGITRYTYDVLGNQTQVINANGGTQTNTFDALGRLLTSISAGGVKTTNTYDLRGNIASTTQAFANGSDSRTTTYGYDLLNRQVKITDPEGFSTTIEYDAFGNQTQVIHGRYLLAPGNVGYDAAKAARALQQTNSFVYDKADHMLSMTDGVGNIITYSYDAAGNRISMTEASNSAPRTTTYAYDKAGRLFETRNPEGGITFYTYDNAGNRIGESVLQSQNNGIQVWSKRSFSYDANARVRVQIDPNGLRTEFEYDALGNQTAKKVAVGTAEQRITRREYDLNNRVSAEIDGKGIRTQFQYDAMGNRIKVTDALNHVARYYFDGSNNLVAILDAEGYINRFTYDSAGHRTGETIHMTQYTGSISDLVAPTAVVSANDRTSQSVYDGNGKVKERIDPLGHKTTYIYDAAGNLSKEIQFSDTATPRTLLYAYDLNNRLTTFTDVDGTLTTFTYDCANNKTSETITNSSDPNAVRKTTFEYDLNNRLIRQAFDPTGLNLVQTIAYDKTGNVVAKTDAAGNTISFKYDLNNQVVAEIDALGNAKFTAYDKVGNRIAVTDARGLTTNFVYDANNRVIQEIAPEVSLFSLAGGFSTTRPTINRSYDAAGNETQLIDAAGNKTTRYYDGNNRLVAELNGDSVLRQWSYSAFGEKVSETLYMTRLAATAHNPAVRPAAPGGEARTTVVEYDKSGRKTRILYPSVAVTTLSGTAGASPTATVATVQPQERFVYDALGNLVETFDRNGNRTVSYYDIKGRVVAQVDPLGYLSEYYYDAQDNVLERRQYAGALNPASISSSSRPAGDGSTGIQTRYSYDAASRLIKERAPLMEVMDPVTKYLYYEWVETRYGYDKVGNQISKTLAAGTVQEVTEYSYFDAANRRVAVIDGNRVVNLFGYDANGNQTLAKRLFNPLGGSQDPATLTASSNFAALVGSNSNDQQINRVYDGLNRLLSETDLMGAGNVDDLTKSFAYDANGNRTRTLDEDGFVQQSSYDALGKVIKQINPDGSGTLSQYDAAGNQISTFVGQVDGTADKGGSYTLEMRYNALNVKIASNAESGLWKEFGVDANGNVLATYNYGLDRVGATITTFTAFDARNREVARFGAATAAGRTITRLTYNWNDKVLRETDGLGRSVQRAWDDVGNQVSETDQLNNVKTFKWDRLGRQVAENDALGNARYKHYDKMGKLIKEVDGEGKATLYGYDVFGRRITVTNALNQSVSMGYDQRDRQVTATDAWGHITYYGYDGRNNRTGAEDSTRRTVNTTVKLDNAQAASIVGDLRFAWRIAGTSSAYTEVVVPKTSTVLGTTLPKADNINFNLVLPLLEKELKEMPAVLTPVQVWVSDGETGSYVTQNQWIKPYAGTQNEVIRKRAQDLGINLTTYDQAFAYQTQYVSDGETTSISYQGWTKTLISQPEKLRDLLIAMGQSARIEAAAINTDYKADYHYYTISNPMEVAKYEIKVYGRNAAGQEVVLHTLASYAAQLSEVSTAAAGPSLTFKSTKSLDGLDQRSAQTWDGQGRLVDTLTLQNGVEVHDKKQYDSGGNLKAEIDGEGRITVKNYGAFGRVSQQVDQGGRLTTFEYDDQGRLVREWSSATGKDIRRSYDNAGQLLEVNDLGTVVNNLDTRVKTVYTYNVSGQKTAEVVTTSGNLHNRSVSYEYDALGQMTRWADTVTGTHTNYAYDGAGNLKKAYTDIGYDPERVNTNYATVLSQVDAEIRAIQVLKTYQVLVSDGEYSSHYETITAMVTPYATGTQNEIIRKRALDLGINLTTYDQAFGKYTYYVSDGETSRPVDTWSSNLLTKTYQLHDLLSAMGYGQKLTTVLNNVGYRLVDHEYLYDKNNQVTMIKQAGAIESQYGYDAAGNRTLLNNKGVVTNYQYDAGGRVLSSSVGGKTTAKWEYDHQGNVTKFTTYQADGVTVKNVTISKFYENNRTYYTESGGQKTTMTLDRSGRTLVTQVVTGTTTITYDHIYNAAGQETNVTGRGGNLTGNSVSTYDANGKLTISNKGVGNGLSRPEILNFVYNNDGQILYRFHDYGKAADITKTEFLYANGNAVGETGNTLADPNTVGSVAKFNQTLLDTGKYNLVQPVGADLPNTTVSTYTARQGDTLQSIAAAMYGNPSLWFVLAEANGLEPGTEIKDGQRIEIPNTVKTGRLTADTHVVYDEGKIIGSTLPNLKSPPPKKGCGSFLMIVIVAVIAIVAVFAVAALALVGTIASMGASVSAAVGGLVSAQVASFAIAGAIVGAVASAVQQGLFMALGYQESFSWKSVAAGAVSGLFSGAAQGYAGVANSLNGVKGAEAAFSFAKIAARAMQVASAASKQLVENGKITSWASLAVAAVGEVKGVSAEGKLETLVAAVGDGSNWGTVLTYTTPWLGVAESYIRTGEVSAGTWASAVASTIGTALSQNNIGTDVVFDGLKITEGQLATNLLVGGALSLVDKRAARDYLTNYVGNEVGNYIGQRLADESGLSQMAGASMQGGGANNDLVEDIALGDDPWLTKDRDLAKIAIGNDPLKDFLKGDRLGAYYSAVEAGKSHDDALAVAKLVVVREKLDALDIEIRGMDKADPLRDQLMEKRLALTGALTSKDVYFDNPIPELIPKSTYAITDKVGLAKVGLTQGMLNQESGYFARVYYDTISEAYVFASRGTEPSKFNDIWADLAQSIGFKTGQYDQALDAAQIISKSVSDVWFTGHSLGGGLASAQAVATGRPAITFNAAAIKEQYSNNLTNAQVKAYYINGEILSKGQDEVQLTIPMIGITLDPSSSATGERIPLPAMSLPIIKGNGLISGQRIQNVGLGEGLRQHGMEYVLHSLANIP